MKILTCGDEELSLIEAKVGRHSHYEMMELGSDVGIDKVSEK